MDTDYTARRIAREAAGRISDNETRLHALARAFEQALLRIQTLEQEVAALKKELAPKKLDKDIFPLQPPKPGQ